jgi:phenylpropionate dioxygenase-like ring-hydroxylating dioxygenase large terminal subunit
VNGKGGMPEGFCREQHGPRKLRTTTFCGLVFGSLRDDVPPIEEYLGAEVASRIERVARRPVRCMGRFTQVLPSNWKLYAENVRDTYHASLLHTFFTTFGITRLTQEGGVFISERRRPPRQRLVQPPDGRRRAAPTRSRDCGRRTPS